MKCYNITVTGKVQDIGFRGIAEYAGRLLDLSGIVFNAKNGSVMIICRGDDSGIMDFSQEIMKRGVQKGALIQDITRQELPFDIDLPYPFSRVLADDDIDNGRKLDKGNELLIDIKRDTSALPEIKSDTSAITAGIDTLNAKFESFIVEQREHNKRMDGHNLRLEKILEKLAEK
jgi:acylphosphatase